MHIYVYMCVYIYCVIHTVWKARDLLSTDGVKGFFRGIVPRICSIAPRNALAFLLYETAFSVASPSQRVRLKEYIDLDL